MLFASICRQWERRRRLLDKDNCGELFLTLAHGFLGPQREKLKILRIIVFVPPKVFLLIIQDLPFVGHSSYTELKNSYLSHLDCTCLTALEQIVQEAQLGELDSAVVPLSPTPNSSGQPATQVEGLSDLNSPESPAIASEALKPDSSKSEAEYRLMKRLYMRRKRAQSTGKFIDLEAVRLRPGRQIRDWKPSRPRPKSYKKRRKTLFNSSGNESSKEPETVVDPEADHVVSVPTPVDEMDQEDESQCEPRSKNGLKKLPRMRNRFLEIGVDSQLASNNNLDLFHLSSLARLMRLYGSLNDLTRPTNEVSISAATIQLFVAIVKEFILNHNKSDDFLEATLPYVAQFQVRVHQKFVQAHLNGTFNDEQPLLPAFFPPSSYWNSDEKDLFLHGLLYILVSDLILLRRPLKPRPSLTFVFTWTSLKRRLQLYLRKYMGLSEAR